MMLKDCIYKFCWSQIWNIGFFKISNNVPSIIPNISWLKHNYTEGWFADPFILKADDKYIELLVEEFNYKLRRGRIDKLIVSVPDYSLEDMHVVLQLDTHLSYPAIYRENGLLYIYPENAESGKITLYTFDEKASTLLNPITILTEPLVDVIIRKIAHQYYLFGTYYGSLTDNDTLHIYMSDSLLGPYKQYDIIKFGNFSARGAGDWIEINANTVIRPCQDGANLNEYGKGLVFHNFTMKNGKMHFEEISRIYPQDTIYNLGLHTYNYLGDLGVTDGIRYRRPILAQYMNKVKKLLK